MLAAVDSARWRAGTPEWRVEATPPTAKLITVVTAATARENPTPMPNVALPQDAVGAM